MKKTLALTALLLSHISYLTSVVYAQNVGVDVATPVEKLDVLGAIRIGTTSNTNAGTIRWTGTNFEGRTGSAWINLGGGGTLTGSGTATRVAFWSGTSALSSNANLYWDNTGSNLGIGTSSPLGKLHIEGAGELLRINSTADNSTLSRIYVNSSPRMDLTSFAATGAQLTLYDGSGTYATRIGAAGPSYFRFGNVGIGTDTPAEKLDVIGKTKTTTFQMTTTPTVNYVLRSDATGNASWVDPNTLITGALPTGTTGQTIRHNGTAWVANSVIYNDGTNVGIGTTAPGFLLHIVQSGAGFLTPVKVQNPGDPGFGATRLEVSNSASGFLLQAYGSGAPGRLASAASIYAASGSRLLLGAGPGRSVELVSNDNYGAPQFILTSGGNVGIGTLSPAQALDVNGKIQMRTGATAGYVPVSDASGTMTWTNPTSLTITETDPQVSSTTTNYIPKWNGTTLVDGVGYDNGTNVGIGTNSPVDKLHVVGGGIFDANGVSGIGITLRAGYQGRYHQGINAYDHNGSFADGLTVNGFDGISFITNNTTSTYGNVKMLIQQNGNVGIATTSPANILHVIGNSRIDGNAIVNANGVNGIGVTLRQGYEGLYHQGLNAYDHNGSFADGLTVNGFDGISFITNNITSTYGNVKMLIQQNGNVGIGTTAPGAYLDITGTNAGTTSLQLRSGNSNVGTSSNQLTFGYSGTETYRHAIKTRHNSGSNATNAIDFYLWDYSTDAVGTVGTQRVMTIDGANGGSVGIGTTAPGYKLDVNGTTAYTGNIWTSDMRKKKNIQTIDLNGLDIISKLHPVTFEWIEVLDDGMRGKQMGFIAQEIEKVLPAMVVTENDAIQSKAVKYNELLPVFVKAMQEQQQMIEELQRQNLLLKTENVETRKSMQAQIDMITEHLNMKTEK